MDLEVVVVHSVYVVKAFMAILLSIFCVPIRDTQQHLDVFFVVREVG